MSSALVVGFDRRPESMAALFVACDLAERITADVHVVHAIDLRDYPTDPDSSGWEEHSERVLEHERLAVREVMSGRTIAWRYRVRRTDPASALLQEAEEVNALMIVVGNRGEGFRTIFERLVSPSITHRLVNRSPRPVLVVGRGVTEVVPRS